MTKAKEESSSPEKHNLASRENSACSAETIDSSPGKDGKGREKGKAKGGSLKKIFSLPEGEELVDDFICALRRKVLYQGRMYIYEHHLCFYSKIFGHQKIVTIPLKVVTQIRKKKHLGFSNSLDIVWKGKRDTFTSFLKRDNAHKILRYAWSKSTPYAKLFGGVEEEDVTVAPKNVQSDSKKVLGSVRLAKLVHRPHGDSSKQIAYDDSTDDDESMYHTGEAGKGGVSSEVASHHDSESDSENETTETAEGTEEWKPVSEPAPSPNPQATLLVDDELDLPVREVYKEFLSDKSQFYPSWHETRGDTQVHLSEWHKHPAVGFVRELTFITPLKQRIGPSKCLCTQTQRVRLHPKDHLIFETSQIMDIPYGDHFSVETRWDYTPQASGKKCKVESRLLIPFSKKTMFKGTIESSTRALCKEANEDFVKAAKKWLEPPIPLTPSAPASCFADDESSGGGSPEKTPSQRPTHFSRADSLKLRMSSDVRIPDADVLAKAPTAYRSEIARVLQLKKLESKQSRFSGQLSRTRTKSLRFGDDEEEGASWSLSDRLRSPAVSIVLALTLLSLLLYIMWGHKGGAFLSLPRNPLSRSHARLGRSATQSRPVDSSEDPSQTLQQEVAAIKAMVQQLKEQMRALSMRVDSLPCES